MESTKWIIMAGALAISLNVAQSGRYVSNDIEGSAGFMVTDTWLWRTTLCHPNGCNEWRKPTSP